ncbi:MAG: zinc ribbon domain-containing protein [Carboxylicivirga sp.]|jgi:hypothetical protein|nr:zinc ribbon domain-containing protein [Carboxylicivirga sp.]
MKCTRCHAENNEQARYCKNCGHSLSKNEAIESDTTKVDKLLIGFIAVVFGIAMFSFLHRLIYDMWFESPLKYLQIGMWMIKEISLVMLPFAIKNKKQRIIGFVLTMVYAIFNMSQLLEWFNV